MQMLKFLILEGTALSKLCDYSFGDHAVIWDNRLEGEFKYANAYNQEFLNIAKQFESKIMTLFIDNIRLYPREVRTDTDNDKEFVNYLMLTNNLLALCSLMPQNLFIIFTGQEDTPIDEFISVPYNVIKIYAVNAIYNDRKVIPFPFGVQRKIGDDNRLEVLTANVIEDKKVEATKVLYINCAIERNKEREALTRFKTNDLVTTRFEKNSKFFPYEKYQDFLDEIKQHRFVACPRGHFNTMDTHRIWESLYMRRVPIMMDHPYTRKLMGDFPVVFLKDWNDLTMEICEKNTYLYKKAQEMDLSRLDLNRIFKKATNNINNINNITI